ncbi:MAG: DNA-directed RNA polymerase subunit alpha C-terminal domain-containing protein [Phycisphaerae bacterium]|jgi:DNA-directed RNA polymerase subunit alpha
MITITEPQVDLFGAQTFTLDNIQQVAEYVNSSEKNKLAFADKIEQQLAGGSKNYLGIGAALAIIGKYAKAVEFLDKAGDSKEKYLELAYCLRKLGEYDKAIEAFDKAGKAGAEVPQVNCGKASVYRVKKDYERTAKMLKACESYKKVSALYHYTLGRYLQDICDYDGAIESYQTAEDLDPTNIKTLFHLAFVLDIRGDEDAAMDCYKQLASGKPAYVNALLNLAVLYEDAGDYSKAINCVARVLKTHPNHQRAILFKKDIESSQTMLYDEEIEKSKDQRNRILETPISDFELSVRSRNCLKKMNINTLGDLLRITETELLAYKNFGETSLNEIRHMLETKNLRLGMGADGKLISLPLPELEEPKAEVDPDVLDRPLGEFEMSVRARNGLESLGVKTIGDIVSKTEDELLGIKNFGATSLSEIKQVLDSLGLDLRKLD